MKLIAATVSLVWILIAAPVGQAAGISLAEVKRENREAIQRACFDTCIEWEAHYCKRVGADRAQALRRGYDSGLKTMPVSSFG
jgi:hypothetical protein